MAKKTKELEPIEEKKAKRLKVLKILIIALCCILDFLQKILTFLYSQYILNNLYKIIN